MVFTDPVITKWGPPGTPTAPLKGYSNHFIGWRSDVSDWRFYLFFTPILLSYASSFFMPSSISSRLIPRYLRVSAVDSWPRNLEMVSIGTPAW